MPVGDLLALLAPACLSIAYGLSGMLKLISPAASARSARGLGVPERLASIPGVRILAMVEVALSVGFAVAWGPFLSVLSAVSAVALSVFTWFLVRAIRLGHLVPCPCFGGIGSPVSGWHVARNLALLVISGLAGIVGLLGLGVPVALASASWADAVWMACLAAAVLAAAGRPHDRARRPDVLRPGPLRPGPLTGQPVPDVELVAPSGQVRTLPQLVGGRAALLIFTKSGCGSCEEAARRAPGWAERLAGVTLIVATSSDASQLNVPPGKALLLLGAGAARRALGVEAMPAAVLLAHDGRIASEVVEGLDQIGAFVAAIEEVLPVRA